MSGGEFFLPEISPRELAGWLAQHPRAIILDVREAYELRYARLDDPRVVHTPLSELARRGAAALPQAMTGGETAVEVVVMCHHGSRSAQVTAWLLQGGWKEVYNLAGGIDAYARLVDPGVGLY